MISYKVKEGRGRDGFVFYMILREDPANDVALIRIDTRIEWPKSLCF